MHKVLAEAGVGSRRACETLIESGVVAVNGHLITTLPAWADPVRDRITVNGRRIRGPEPHVYIMLFKPRGVVSTNDDPQGRRRAIDLVDHPLRTRLYPVGRLDVDSSGLLLLTNDGELANRLTHPRYGIHKTYEVTIDGTVDEEELGRLSAGVFLPDRQRGRGRRTVRSKMTMLKRDRDRTRVRMELREGRNRQIRRMMLRVGHKVRKLRRIELGPLKLKGLRPGQWRELLPAELTALRRSAARRG
ncbi:MAG: rRNA pseudouridine synthase [Phycisphaerales bacterium]|nr:rRNA pseudouridine synthase [Phycisphaerae bacterium]NNF44420.1 rRNA pseudouridine synthase [Phycisphaerales bacterium]NNM24656.1 rRNA pseudouridine synthase [Phycisphaerales bacterium]